MLERVYSPYISKSKLAVSQSEGGMGHGGATGRAGVAACGTTEGGEPGRLPNHHPGHPQRL